MAVKYDIGSSFRTNQGDVLTIVDREGPKAVIKFSHPNTPEDYTQETYLTNVRTGEVKNPFFPSAHGVGFFGEARGVVTKTDAVYRTWESMLQRCYSENYKAKYPTYTEATCVAKWHHLAEFKRWFDKNYVEGHHLDKDILVRGNKLYSPKTCCFVPGALNKLLTKRGALRGPTPIGVTYEVSKGKYRAGLNDGTGKRISLGTFDTERQAFKAYKRAKEALIKRLAEEYFSRQEITRKVYLALIEYTVEVDD